MTKILSLPQISAIFRVANNAGWYDAVAFKLVDKTTPLDISGIRFRGHIRPTADSPVVLFDIDTTEKTLLLDGPNGVLTWNVPIDLTSKLEAGEYALDLLAEADGYVVNLFQKSGPAKVTVHQGVTR